MHNCGKGYTHGCKCPECLAEHAGVQRRYRADARVKAAQMKAEFAAMQVELTMLRQWQAKVLATAPSATGAQVP
jgi:hypothetical protein